MLFTLCHFGLWRFHKNAALADSLGNLYTSLAFPVLAPCGPATPTILPVHHLWIGYACHRAVPNAGLFLPLTLHLHSCCYKCFILPALPGQFFGDLSFKPQLSFSFFHNDFPGVYQSLPFLVCITQNSILFNTRPCAVGYCDISASCLVSHENLLLWEAWGLFSGWAYVLPFPTSRPWGFFSLSLFFAITSTRFIF